MQQDILLKIEGVKGESTAKGYAGTIELRNWSFSCSTPADFVTKQATGRMQVTDLSVTKALDKSSPILIMACKENRVFSKAELIVRKAGGDQREFYRVEMKNMRVRGVAVKGHGSDGITPEETVALSFQRISWNYMEQQVTGTMQATVTAEFDVTTNA